MLNITDGFYQAKDNFRINGKYLDFFSQMICMGIYRLMEIKYRVSKCELVNCQKAAPPSVCDSTVTPTPQALSAGETVGVPGKPGLLARHGGVFPWL